jgi:hypothetical protein
MVVYAPQGIPINGVPTISMYGYTNYFGQGKKCKKNTKEVLEGVGEDS